MIILKDFKQISPFLWEIPKSFRTDMRVPARVYASQTMLQSILKERAVEQLINVATLPGVTKHALAMPDIHQGYGFPIGGVAAIRTDDGIISPGGVGYDINCGVRLLTSSYSFPDIKDQIVNLANQIQRDVPSGVGRGGRIKLSHTDLDQALNQGVGWAINQGYGQKNDQNFLEESGHYQAAEAKFVSDKAHKRGSDQLGTLGAGNHFIEVQEVKQIYDESTAKAFGLFKNQVTVMIHTGSRGLGHQVCTDYVRLMNQVLDKYKIKLPDRELVCAPFKSGEGQQYFKAMAAAANFAWTNRQLITHLVRGAWQQVLGKDQKNPLNIVYDVAHNIAKLEKHGDQEFIVHRKGATRAFGPGQADLPDKYQATGQPVIIPGSMGTASYVLAGTQEAMDNTFGSTCHGAGRQMSRTQAKKSIDYNKLRKDLDQLGVVVRVGSAKGLLEEAPGAYKDIDEVVEVVSRSNVARKVVKLKPLAVIKG